MRIEKFIAEKRDRKKNQWGKSGFSENINKTDKPLVREPRKKANYHNQKKTSVLQGTKEH